VQGEAGEGGAIVTPAVHAHRTRPMSGANSDASASQPQSARPVLSVRARVARARTGCCVTAIGAARIHRALATREP